MVFLESSLRQGIPLQAVVNIHQEISLTVAS